jgi:glycosyltransferase involved in cell wall biosynthesis
MENHGQDGAVIDLTLGQRDPDVIVSVMIPSFNRLGMLKRAIASVMDQQVEGLHLIVSDNGSKDGTQEWLRAFEIAAAVAYPDTKVSLILHPENLGSTRNFNGLFAAADGKYSCFLADDDWHEPGFLANAIAALEADPETSLVIPKTLWFNEGLLVDESPAFDASSDSVADRLAGYFSRLHTADNSELFGVWRTEMLPITGDFLDIPGDDAMMVAQWLTLGRGQLRDSVQLNRSAGGLSANPVALAQSVGLPVSKIRDATLAKVMHFYRSLEDHPAFLLLEPEERTEIRLAAMAAISRQSVEPARDGVDLDGDRWSRSKSYVPQLPGLESLFEPEDTTGLGL